MEALGSLPAEDGPFFAVRTSRPGKRQMSDQMQEVETMNNQTEIRAPKFTSTYGILDVMKREYIHDYR